MEEVKEENETAGENIHGNAEADGNAVKTDARPPLPEKPVRITVTERKEGADGPETRVIELEAHTPSILRAVKALPDGCDVKFEVAGYAVDDSAKEAGGSQKVVVKWRTPFDCKKKADVVKELEEQVIPAELVPRVIHNYLKYVFDHSDLKACGVSVVVGVDGTGDATAAFVVPGNHCTNAQAVALVNVMDANTSEFIAKAKLEVPGRNAPKMGDIILPTGADREKLGIV